MSNSNRASVTFDIISVNDAPIIGGTPNKIAIEQSPYSFTPTASDVEGDELSFSIINKPSWASFDRSTGRLYGTPSESNIGLYASLIISVYDGDEILQIGGISAIVISVLWGIYFKNREAMFS